MVLMSFHKLMIKGFYLHVGRLHVDLFIFGYSGDGMASPRSWWLRVRPVSGLADDMRRQLAVRHGKTPVGPRLTHAKQSKFYNLLLNEYSRVCVCIRRAFLVFSTK